MTIQLPEDLERLVNAELLNGHYSSGDELIAAALRDFLSKRDEGRLLAENSPATEAAPTTDRKPVWERILDRTASVPDGEWDKVPTDLAEQHDHYIYGTAKRPTA